MTLQVVARDSGRAPQVFWDTTPSVSPKSNRLTDSKLTTDATRLWFLAVDPSGEHETGAALPWSNRLNILHQPREGVGSRSVELRVVPRGAIKYTLTGANPADGTPYSAPINIGVAETVIYSYAEDQGVSAKRNFTIPPAGNAGIHIDPTKKARLKKRVDAPDTAGAFKLVARAKQASARFTGASVEVGVGAKNASVRFGSEAVVTAEHIEAVIAALRGALGDEMAEVRVTVRAVDFASGHDLDAFVKDWALQVGANEVEQ